jgi:hypothetical protein
MRVRCVLYRHTAKVASTDPQIGSFRILELSMAHGTFAPSFWVSQSLLYTWVVFVVFVRAALKPLLEMAFDGYGNAFCYGCQRVF